MSHKTNSSVIETGFILLIGFACFVFILTHQFKPVNTDVAWLVEVGKRWLDHGKYIADYYETNPPLAFYVYLPIYYLIKTFQLNLSMSFVLYYGVLTALSLSLVSACLKIQELALRIHIVILLGLMLWFFYLPFFQMGQRDPLSSILVVPHVLYTLISAEKKARFSIPSRIIIFLLAIIGYMVKPYFILVWCCLFLTLWYRARSFKQSIKQSQCVMFFILGFVYLGIIFLYHRDFFTVALPLTWQVYYPTIVLNSRLELMLLDPLFVFRAWLFGFFILTAYRQLRGAIPCYAYGLMVLSSGYTLTYLLQGVGFSYQGIPALTFSSILACSIAIDAFNEKGFIFFLGLGLLSILISYQNNRFSTANFTKDMWALKQVIKLIPKGKSVNVLHCENYTAYPVVLDANRRNASIFPTMQQPCLAYVRYVLMHHRHLKTASQKLAKLMQDDLLKNQPDYLITVNDNTPIHRKELAVFDDIFIKQPTQLLWQQYKVIERIGEYAIRERINV